LKAQLAATMDFGENFAKATTILQGGGVDVILNTFETMESLRIYCANPTFPNVVAIAKEGNFEFDPTPFCQTATRYFLEGLPDLSLYRAARLLHPQNVGTMDVNDEDLSKLGDATILRSQLPLYVGCATSANEDVLAWWKTHGHKIPAWKAAARRIFAISPTSAAAERVFSLLNSYVSDRQDGLLDDKVELMLMLQTK